MADPAPIPTITVWQPWTALIAERLKPSGDGSIITTEDTSKMRTCSRFLRMFWARMRKADV